MIRFIEEKDAAAVAEICRKSLGHNVTEDDLKNNIMMLKNDPEYYICVYISDDTDEIRGFIQAQKYDILYGGRGWNIIALAAAADCRNRGIGKELLKSLENFAKKKGCSFIRLNSRTERIEAHGFYEHMGYNCDKTQKRFIKYL